MAEETRRVLRDALLLSALLAVVALSALAIAGLPRAAEALGVGLVLGSLNGPAIYRTLHAGSAFALTSVTRLSLLSVAGLALGFALGSDVVWLVVIGLAGAQLALAAAAIRVLVTR